MSSGRPQCVVVVVLEVSCVRTSHFMAPSAREMNFHLHLGYSIVSSSVVVGWLHGRQIYKASFDGRAMS